MRNRTGIYSFRWNIPDNGKYRQAKLSLRPRHYLKAINLASTLALKITSVGNLMPEDVQAIYREFRGETNKASKRIQSLDVEATLTEFALKFFLLTHVAKFQTDRDLLMDDCEQSKGSSIGMEHSIFVCWLV